MRKKNKFEKRRRWKQEEISQVKCYAAQFRIFRIDETDQKFSMLATSENK